MNVMNRGHYQYNESSEGGEFVCNGHYPQDSAEIVCLDEKSATWLRANATFPGVRWHHARMLVVASTEDALRVVGKAIGDGLRVTTNHIPAVAEADPTRDDTQPGPAVDEPAGPGYSLDGPAGPGYYLERASDGKVYPFDPSAPEHQVDMGMGDQEIPRRAATPEERAQMIRDQDPNRPITKGMQEYLDFRKKIMDDVKKDWPWLDFGESWLPHDYQFDSPYFFEFLKKRKYATYHDAQIDGYVPRTKDIALLDGEFVHRMSILKANQNMIANLRRGRTNEGGPLVIEENSSGYKPVGLREFKVIHPDALEKLKAAGSLRSRLESGTIFEAQSGAYVELIEVYAHPKIAAHLKKTIADTYATIMAEWKRAGRKPSTVRMVLDFISPKRRRKDTGQ